MKTSKKKGRSCARVGSTGGSAGVRTLPIEAHEYNGEYGQYGIGIAGRMLSFDEAEAFAHRILNIVEKHKLSLPNVNAEPRPL